MFVITSGANFVTNQKVQRPSRSLHLQIFVSHNGDCPFCDIPIPNREVKPACADGTAMQCGRVGGRLLYMKQESHMRLLFFCVMP